eukprot:TRINITY_DN65621_c10_g5_i1.p1 TRINITY_DN65621_c10_g5~~TRINITY_DN65621_c10_g5_i1.p1  ORF type:complete len:324 (-),score=188.38 TRINITY_DN65621_c10_g5_i1:86-988(-)
MAENIGIMSGAFFVGKRELLNWLSDTFKVNYTKVEDTCTGAIHCQILDSIYPGKVPLHKVNFDAAHDYEWVKNWKVLQTVFDKQNIQKHVDVQKLIKGKYQDNLEFLQWMKNFWDVKYSGQEYDAEARRAAAKKRYGKGRKFAPNKALRNKRASGGAAAGAARAGARRSGAAAGTKRASGGVPRAGAKKGGAKEATLKELNDRLAKLRLTIEGLEKERNFYFGKLREIEVLCQTDEEEAAEFKGKVLEILYATDDNDEFEAPAADEEEPVGDDAVAEAEEDEEEVDYGDGDDGDDADVTF